MLSNYFAPEGASIKSIFAITASGNTAPTALNRVDVNSEVGKLLRCLTPEEYAEIKMYHVWRALGDLATTKATAARQEARNRGKRRRLKAAIAEVERVWQEKRKRGA